MRHFLSLLFLAFLAACSTDYIDEDLKPLNPDERKTRGLGKFFGEDSITFGRGAKKYDDDDVGMGVNSYLWRASLDTLSFMPIASADPFGGIIIFDWYSPPESPNERFKTDVYVLSRQLRSDGLRVSIFRQVRKGGQWVDAPNDPKVERQIENTILSNARKFRSQS